MDEKSLRQVQASIAAKKVSIPQDEARDLAKRALQFKNQRGRLPDINAADAWEKRMAEGMIALARYHAQAKVAQAQSGQRGLPTPKETPPMPIVAQPKQAGKSAE